MEEIVRRLTYKRLREVDEYSEDSHVLAHYSKIPDYLYSATLYPYLDDIAKYGFGNKNHKVAMGGSYGDTLYDGDGIFLAVDPDEAMMYLSDNDPEDVVLLRVPKSILDRNKLYYDTNNSYTLDYLNGYEDGLSNNINNITYFYAGIITNPTEKIEIID